MNTTEFKKLRSTLRAKFSGMAHQDPQYYRVLQLMDVAEKYHSGTRKDGITHEFYHQLSILGLAHTQHRNLNKPVLVYLAILAHDLIEDFPESRAELTQQFPDVLEYSIRLSKNRDGVEIPKGVYFSEMAQCEICSVVKLLDRLHNLSTMQGVFNNAKMLSYAAEVETYFLPLAKTARRLFPNQEAVFELTKSMLVDQVKMIQFFVPQVMASEKRVPTADTLSM